MAYTEGVTPLAYATMRVSIQLYNDILQKVTFFYKQLQLGKHEKTTGRTLAISIIESISLAIFKQANNIATKRSIWKIFNPPCSYKTLVVNLNRCSTFALLILTCILKWNRKRSHLVKHTDATDIPVCLFKNANAHKTMQGLAQFGHSGKGIFYGLKMHITTDLGRRMLAVKFSAGNVADKEMFIPLNRDLVGFFVADAGYIGKKLAQDFYQEGRRILFAKPRKNMKKLMTKFEEQLYGTRMLIELNFRNLKLFYGLLTSLPRSVHGYLAHYIYSLLAYHVA